MVKNGQISTIGLKSNAKIYNELVFDVNSLYFEESGGYEFAKRFYEKAYVRLLYSRRCIIELYLRI